MPTEPPASFPPSPPIHLVSAAPASAHTERREFHAPALDRVLASIDFTALTVGVTPRRLRVEAN